MQDQSGLLDKLKELGPQKAAEIKEIKAKYGELQIGTCTVSQAYGGMRSVKSMITETSLLDAQEGIRFRGLSIPEVQARLPKFGHEEPTPEGLYWLLMTGDVPTAAQSSALTAEFGRRAVLPKHVRDLIAQFPKEMHPMSQLSAAVLAAQTQSRFAKAYQDGSVFLIFSGENKKNLWLHAHEDSLDLIAQLPEIAARIYRHKYHDGKTAAYSQQHDWSANYARMMGFNSAVVDDLFRLYLVIHSDHEGGNVSAHTTHLVGSALSDPYLSYSAGMCGLAGPLHGLANQEVLGWLLEAQEKLKGDLSSENLTKFCWDTLNGGQVIPGYGHAVLRKTDPRYTAQREFALKHLPNDPLFHLVAKLYEIVPGVLTQHGKTANPWPNVDSHSGVLLRHFGITEFDYYTVMFGVSRGLGVLASLTWDRILGFPLERPKSVTTEWVKAWAPKQPAPAVAPPS